ncbi:MAG: hypothetical protein JXR86_18785 [Spirochaetales bacterium]|nr:hypothetical protein [Spirochaetales bacterium]
MKKIILLTVFLPALFSCKTTEPLPVESEPQEIVVQEPPAQIIEEPVTEEVEIVVPDETPADDNEGMIVSEDLYNRTFDEIENLIDELTKLIRKKNFNGWKNFLSEKYIEKVGSAEYLREVSESPSLKDVVELKTLRDYFQWVVVPSRASARLDEIIFKDETHVTAYMYIEENPTILFQFELIDEKWAVTVW